MRLSKPGYLLHGQISIEEGDSWIRPWRLPASDIDLYPSPDDRLKRNAGKTSGVRLQFQTDAKRIRLSADIETAEETDNRRIDICQRGKILNTIEAASGDDSLEIELTGDSHFYYEIWFPTFAEVKLRSLELSDADFISTGTDTRKRWLTYGSSISHCRAASSPAMAWPSVAARIHNLHLTNMGFGGECHLDGMIAKTIRNQDFDLLTLKLGINVYGLDSLNKRSYLPAVINLIDTIREYHPDCPLGIISPIYCCPRETRKNLSGMTLPDFRKFNEEAVGIFQKRGDRHIYYFNGLELINEAEASMLPDDLHPNGEGYELMGKRFAGKDPARITGLKS